MSEKVCQVKGVEKDRYIQIFLLSFFFFNAL